MTRLLLESVSVPKELVDQRLAMAPAHTEEQLKANGNPLRVPQQTPTAAIIEAAGGSSGKKETDDLMDDE